MRGFSTTGHGRLIETLAGIDLSEVDNDDRIRSTPVDTYTGYLFTQR
jgi:hypothetical protein